MDNICVGFGTGLCRQIVGVPVGAGCAPLVAGLFLFCYEGDFVASLSDVGRAEIVGAFESASEYLDDLLSVDSPCFEGVVNRIYPPELQLSRADASDAGAPFLDLHLSISNGFVSSGVCGGRDGFDFGIVGFPFLDGDVPRSASCGNVFLNLFGLLGCLVVWLVSVPVVGVWLPNFSNRAVGIINFERLSPNFIADTMNWFLGSVLDWEHFCIKAYRNRNFMVT